MRLATLRMTLESSTNMQRFISGSSLPPLEPEASGLHMTIGRSGKEPEKPLGKIFAKIGTGRDRCVRGERHGADQPNGSTSSIDRNRAGCRGSDGQAALSVISSAVA
jgi:hypothetical protein